MINYQNIPEPRRIIKIPSRVCMSIIHWLTPIIEKLGFEYILDEDILVIYKSDGVAKHPGKFKKVKEKDE